MSETDSFIEEVSEEVRRDRLYGYMRRYGWIAVALVVALVGGAAYNEYTKTQARAAAEGLGDAIVAALDEDAGTARLEALGAIEAAGAAAPVLAMMQAAEALEVDDPAAAASALEALIADADTPALYRDLATLKHAILTAGTTDAAARITALEPLAAGGPFRVLAEEQIALAELEQGDAAAAIARLRALLVDNETSQGLRVRAQQLIVALGGELDPA